ncbi:FadR family transcriptional regulator [Tianweitania sp. BSSL-BM11]|uniref:FadR family transcriptional regulator n=1 Tax=Tianweitania aestuarii TaxID=2814886 RepID=A0ABS5RYP7_9HYPH|nr:FadR/GntR family transcriptional regulator [Tianweitania aestuarii]MBS9722163.1 FadR family transcriptional regulator [Tianweitania aestuarii]
MILKSAISGSITRNSHARVVDELGKAIVGGIYSPGAVLPGDAELAERFDVSRTVLREAMKTLTAKGLVVPKARIGTRVTERSTWNLFDGDVLIWHLESGNDPEFISNLAEMRLSFEPFAANLAAKRANGAEIARLFACVEAMEKADAMDSFAVADLEFHLTLLEISKNPFMFSVGSLIEAALVTSFRLSSPNGEPRRQKATSDAHRTIVKAIAAGNGNEAATAMQAVIIDGRDRIAGQITRS